MTTHELRKLEDNLLGRCSPHNHAFQGPLRPETCMRCELIDTLFELKRLNRIKIAILSKQARVPKERLA